MAIEPLVGETRFVAQASGSTRRRWRRFTRNVTVPNVGQSVRFDAGTTTDDETLANSAYEWDFDNNGSYEQVGQVVQRTFATPGNKTGAPPRDRLARPHRHRERRRPREPPSGRELPVHAADPARERR